MGQQASNSNTPKIGSWNEWANELVNKTKEHTELLKEIDNKLDSICAGFNSNIAALTEKMHILDKQYNNIDTRLNTHITAHKDRFSWVGTVSGIIAIIVAGLLLIKTYILK